MSILTAIMILGAFAALCFMQASDNKKLSKRISELEKIVKPEVTREKSN